MHLRDIHLTCVSPTIRSVEEAAERGEVFSLTWRQQHANGEWSFSSKRLGVEGRALVGKSEHHIVTTVIAPGVSGYSITGDN